jgi:archaellum component FlaC
LRKKLDTYNKELEILKNDAKMIESSVQEIKTKINNIGGKKMQNQKETVESISREIFELSSKITTAKGIF